MRSILASLLLLTPACGDDGGGPDAAIPTPDAAPPRGDLTFEAQHYDVEVTLDDATARSRVTLLVTSPGDCLEIGYRPNNAEGVTIDGQPARDVDDGGERLRACGAGWDAGTTIVLEVSGDIPIETWNGSQVGYSTWLDRDGEPYTYLVSWVGGCDRHSACDARPDTFATYRFTVNHPEGTRVLCSGNVTPGATSTVCDLPFAGGPTYSTYAFMASPNWTETSLGDWNGVAVTMFDYPSSGTLAAFDDVSAGDMFQWMQTTFGDYPYGDELRFVVGPTYWAGFEHPGNISLSETLANGTSSYFDGLMHTTMHEIAHQWAGDQTTLASTYDFVWKEAMAEYLTYVYEDENLPPEVAAATRTAWKAFAFQSSYYLVPDERPPLLDYYGDVYGPGPMILFRQLELFFGREPIIAALQALIGSGPRTLSVEDVRMALEDATGADLVSYFDGWAFGSGIPRFPRAQAGWTEVGPGAYEVTTTVTTFDDVVRPCRFSIRLTGGPDESFDIPLEVALDGTQPAPVTVTPGFTPTNYTVDPDAQCLIWKGMAAPAPDPDVPGRRSIEPWRVR